MSLSKQRFDVLSFYNDCLVRSPILTKALTSGIIGFTGAYVSSKIRNSKNENLWRSTGPLTIYSSLFAAPITHYFYSTLQTIFGPNVIAKVLVDRLVFCPIFVFFTLYILDRLQGSGHADTWQKVKTMYFSVLLANYKVWTVPQLINLTLIPVKYQVLFANLVAFFWNIYLAKKTTKIE